MESLTSVDSNATSEFTSSEVTNTTVSNESSNQLTVTTMSMEVKEIKTSTTTIVTTTTTSAVNNNNTDTVLSATSNHTNPLTAPSGDCPAKKEGDQSEDAAGDSRDEKPKSKVISLQSLIPSMKAASLQLEDKSGALAKVATSGAKTVLVVNRDGGKVIMQMSAPPVEKTADESTSQESSSSTSATASGEPSLL